MCLPRKIEIDASRRATGIEEMAQEGPRSHRVPQGGMCGMGRQTGRSTDITEAAARKCRQMVC
ncbi:hypothetical protein GCM10027425_07480 [Alteromonas gracilis]